MDIIQPRKLCAKSLHFCTLFAAVPTVTSCVRLHIRSFSGERKSLAKVNSPHFYVVAQFVRRS